MRIVHITSVHRRQDPRIFLKMSKSLTELGYEVSILVADGYGEQIVDGVKILDVGRSSGRWRRIVFAQLRLARKAKTLDCDIFHLHDPELLLLANWLRIRGHNVVFDSHEDVPAQLLVKPYLPVVVRYIFSKLMSVFQVLLVRRLSGVIAATAFIRDKFQSREVSCIDINNYPLLSEFSDRQDWYDRSRRVIYIGGLERIRGVHEMVSAIELSSESEALDLCGEFKDPVLKNEVVRLPGWSKVCFHGFVGRTAYLEIVAKCMVGLVVLHPTVNYRDALPVKMFEYMAAGIPVIASDFPAWHRIVGESRCGILVDPMNKQEVADAIDELLSNPARARELGEAGRRAILKKYNWEAELEKLIDFYSHILGRAL